jgi:hypothetical protein
MQRCLLPVDYAACGGLWWAELVIRSLLHGSALCLMAGMMLHVQSWAAVEVAGLLRTWGVRVACQAYMVRQVKHAHGMLSMASAWGLITTIIACFSSRLPGQQLCVLPPGVMMVAPGGCVAPGEPAHCG